MEDPGLGVDHGSIFYWSHDYDGKRILDGVLDTGQVGDDG
jgi:hypothetical protein